MTVDVNTLQRFFKSLTHADKLNCRAENTTDSDAVIFLFVGRLLDWKGVRELIEAFNGLTHPKAWLWIVGEGDLTAEVNLAAERNPKIRALGRRSDEDLWRIYAASDVVVVPSYEEPWGLVVNEAMAAAKPVIGSNRVGCVEDLVFHESTGLVIEPKDVGALQNAMQWLLDHPLSRVEMGQAAATLMKKWTLEDEVDNIIEGWGRFFGECETD
ncbi:MAG: glycosyltransferase [Gammaproteobacteria bacterium]|nr:glycosyltransferase [Gammaproteobacteria bacterium]